MFIPVEITHVKYGETLKDAHGPSCPGTYFWGKAKSWDVGELSFLSGFSPLKRKDELLKLIFAPAKLLLALGKKSDLW